MRTPSIFIGSSTEGLEFARAIRSQLAHDAEVTIWDEGLFRIGSTYIETLEDSLSRFDFAILVFTPDDLVNSRANEAFGPRDNVIFELGWFMSHIGRERTFFVYQSNMKMKIPSDLSGIAAATYEWPRRDNNYRAAVGKACDTLREPIKRLSLINRPSAFTVFRFVNKFSGKCLDVELASLEDGAPIMQYDYNRGKNQLWTLNPIGGNYYYIRAEHSGKYLAVSPNEQIVQLENKFEERQRWQIDKAIDGSYVIYQTMSRHRDEEVLYERASSTKSSTRSKMRRRKTRSTYAPRTDESLTRYYLISVDDTSQVGVPVEMARQPYNSYNLPTPNEYDPYRWHIVAELP